MDSPKIYRNRYVCSLDWLQIFCARPLTWREGEGIFTSPQVSKYGTHHTYCLKGAKEYLKGYAQQRTLWFGKYSLAIVAWSPVDSRVSPTACAVKLLNPVLYVADWRFYLYDILAALGWQMKNITRADFCIDFNKFANGLLPQTFLREYISDRSRSHGSYFRVGSNKVAAHMQKQLTHCNVESLRWGSRESGVSTYMYNKSLELQQKKFKDWICEQWKAAGLVVGNPALPVWRIEFSVSTKGMNLLDSSSGALDVLQPDMFDTTDKVALMCQAYAQKYFRFKRIPNSLRKLPRHAKDLEEVQLIRWEDVCTIKPITLQRPVDSGRTERMISRRLHALSDDIEDATILGRDRLLQDLPAIKRTADLYDEVAAVKAFRNSMNVANSIKPTDHVLSDEYVRAIDRLHFRERDRNILYSQLSTEFVARQLMKRK